MTRPDPPIRPAPGAMTHAMHALARAAGPKVLRVGIMAGTRITDERVIRDRSAVTLGTTEHNTFTLTDPELPARFELFSVDAGGYALHFTDAMEGQLATPDGVRKLGDLRRHPGTQRTPEGYRVALSDSSRGKVSVGGVLVLFQFVTAPPVMPKPQLPAALRASWVKGVDWTYNGCFSAFLVLAIASVAYVEYAYDPVVDDVAILDDARLVRLLAAPPPDAEPDATPDEPAAPDEAAAAAPTAAPARNAPPSRRPAAPDRVADDRRRAEAAAAAADRAVEAATGAMRSAEFAALTATTMGRGNARDVLANGALTAETENDLRLTNGITTATGAVGVRRSALAAAGPVGGHTLGANTLAHNTGDTIGTGPAVLRERPIGSVTPLDPIDTVGEGSINADAVARLIRGQIGGIRACYERELRQNPALAGRLDVSLTIGASGRITQSSASGLSASPAVGSCVTGRIRGLVFPMPEGGSVEFTFPFTFTPGG